MPIKFTPKYTITPKIVAALMKIEATKEKVQHLPLTPTTLASLRESARFYTTHYSTMIEGNRLEPKQVKSVLQKKQHFPGRKRDENEVRGYYSALEQVEKWAVRTTPITENLVKKMHAILMSTGRIEAKPTPYRDGQNVIRDSSTNNIVYLPPEAKDVPSLMRSMTAWITENLTTATLPCPIIAGIAHYQFATIHPYYDGNGRCARLLTTMILHLGGYNLKGLYSLEEYYAHNLAAYYEAICTHPHHNYYMGRETADITKWVEYFTEGMVNSFAKVLQHMTETKQENLPDQSELIRALDPKQRIALELFQQYTVVTAKQIGELFNFKPRTSTQLCKKWVEAEFIEATNLSNKGRKYKLGKKYRVLKLREKIT